MEEGNTAAKVSNKRKRDAKLVELGKRYVSGGAPMRKKIIKEMMSQVSDPEEQFLKDGIMSQDLRKNMENIISVNARKEQATKSVVNMACMEYTFHKMDTFEMSNAVIDAAMICWFNKMKSGGNVEKYANQSRGSEEGTLFGSTWLKISPHKNARYSCLDNGRGKVVCFDPSNANEQPSFSYEVYISHDSRYKSVTYISKRNEYDDLRPPKELEKIISTYVNYELGNGPVPHV